MKVIDLKGQTFGRLTLIERVEEKWKCKCSCGMIILVRLASLKRGHTRSCGCLQREIAKERSTHHGMAWTRTWKTWRNLRRRCTDKNYESYSDYGAKGITFCKRWESFENFLTDMGERPPGKTIDRKDGTKGYEPGNCKWSAPKEQAHNRKTTHLVSFNGESKSLKQWSKALNIPYGRLCTRITKLRWSAEKAFTTPLFGKTQKEE